ncbi:hypothetical protein KC357_g8291 [Hortaea werneckii]|nr:hypothetical protein KC357_g8291 [Hortaea werneckii]
MDQAIVFDRQRLLVGWRLCDWSPIWYEPIASEDEDGPVYDGNGGAEIGLYKLSTGDPGYREPMTGELAWFAPFDWKTFQATEKKEKLALQKQFMADAYKYLSTDNRREEKKMEKDFHRLHYTRWYKFFEAAKLYKRRKRQARSSTGTAGVGAAAAEQEQEEVLSEDSGFESNIGLSSRPRVGTEMPPPRTPASNIDASARKRKRDSQPKRHKVSKANPKPQRRLEDEAPPSFDAEESVRRYTPRQNSVSLMSGGLGSDGGIPTNGIHDRRSNHFATPHTEDTIYEGDYVFSRRQSENPRGGSISQNHPPTRFSSPEEAEHEREGSSVPYQNLRPFKTWGDGDGATNSNTSFRVGSQPRSEPAYTNILPGKYATNRRPASEVDVDGYNMGLSDTEALKRALRESAAPEARPHLANRYEDDVLNINDHILEDVRRSIEGEGEEDKLWEE